MTDPSLTPSHRRVLVQVLVVALFTLAAFAGLASFIRAQPIARAPERSFVPPSLAHLPPLRVCWLEYATNDVSGQVSSAGLSKLDRWSVTVAGLLVRHPAGDVVVDVGNSSHFREEIADYPLASRLFLEAVPGSNVVKASAPEALRAAGVDPFALRWIILSHAHVDHAGGLTDLPGAPVLLPREESAFFVSASGTVDVVPAHREALVGRTHELIFAARPYENFASSYDVFGDGSIVVVPLSGHTPGSVGTFVNVSPQKRFFHVGDAVNVLEAVERRVTKSIVMTSTDHDKPRADAVVAQLAQLHEHSPSIVILPAHDRAAWQRALGEPGHCVE
jgi:glyoxylase-like metal-dependent hydrolase (beta-lactamase superfamily II)